MLYEVITDLVSSWGSFEEDKISINTLGKNNAQAVKIFDLAGWKYVITSYSIHYTKLYD